MQANTAQSKAQRSTKVTSCVQTREQTRYTKSCKIAVIAFGKGMKILLTQYE